MMPLNEDVRIAPPMPREEHTRYDKTIKLTLWRYVGGEEPEWKEVVTYTCLIYCLRKFTYDVIYLGQVLEFTRDEGDPLLGYDCPSDNHCYSVDPNSVRSYMHERSRSYA